MPESNPANTRIPLSPRRRRLRLTVAWLSASAAIGLVVGVVFYVKSRPEKYRTDERPPDITSSLSRKLPPEAPKPRFSDVTAEAGLATFRNFIGDRTSQMPEDMGPGLAWGDFDNDGDDDLFLVSAGGALGISNERLPSCELHENKGGGRFVRVTEFPELRIRGMAAAWGDYDSDGFLDLALSGYNALHLFRNETGEAGRRRFASVPLIPNQNGFWSGISWGDFDNDRDLDLYVCGYVQYVENEADRNRGSQQVGSFVPYTLNPASYPPALNLLLRNNSDGTFTDVAPELGVTNPTGRSLGALWHDFDDDGWLDLYVANDVSDNAFYRNLGRRFQDISHPAWVADYRSAMGLAAGDYNRDGDDDIFITHWVAQENALYDNLWADFNANTNQIRTPQPATPSATASAVQQSNAPSAKPYPLRFVDVNEPRGLGQLALPFVGWGTEFVDVDADGWLDLIVVNGNTLEFEGPIPRKLKPQEPFLLWNQRGEFFHDIAAACKPLTEQHVSRGMAVADYDNDGDMDIAIAQLGEGVQLLRNDMQSGNWLRLRLRSKVKDGSPRGFGDGAKVIATAGDAMLRRTVSSVSYLSQSSRTLHFGLGNATVAARIEVRWLGGGTNVFTNVDANATWEITEGETTVRKLVSTTNAPLAAANQSSTAAPLQRPLSAADEKARIVEFWKTQRAAMNALKVENDIPKAIQLMRAALQLDPRHEDSHYYLAQCLAVQDQTDEALKHFRELTIINPQSHRGFQQWGTLRAIFARSPDDLKAAEESLDRAHAINPEETGALLVLGEISLLRGDAAKAEQRFAAACRSNPRAVGGLFLRGYIAWKQGDAAHAKQLLGETRRALGKEWQPRGTTAEGDVKQKQHVEKTPLARFWENWNGNEDPPKAFAAIDAFLNTQHVGSK